LDGPAHIFCGNLSVVKSSTQPECTLSKKHNAIAYHKVREAVAGGWIRIANELTKTNLTDLLTKPLSAQQRGQLLECFMHSFSLCMKVLMSGIDLGFLSHHFYLCFML
jgi:hypothetical protein